MTQVSQQDQTYLGMSIERRSVGIDQSLMSSRLRQRDLHHVDAAPRWKPVHCRLHAVVVEVSVQNCVAWTQLVVPADERLQCFGSPTCQRNLANSNTELLRDSSTNPLQVRFELPPHVERISLVDSLQMLFIGSQHGFRTDAPIPVLELDHLTGHVVLRGDGAPVSLVRGKPIWRHVPAGTGPRRKRTASDDAGCHTSQQRTA